MSVCGVPAPAVGVPVAVDVPVAVAVAVAVPVAFAVEVAVGVTAPPSSKTINGFAHQPIFARACVDGVGVGVAVPKGLEQALKNTHTRIMPPARNRPIRLSNRLAILPDSAGRIPDGRTTRDRERDLLMKKNSYMPALSIPLYRLLIYRPDWARLNRAMNYVEFQTF